MSAPSISDMRAKRRRSSDRRRGRRFSLWRTSRLVAALETAGLKTTATHPTSLAPADARAAFERGSVDAWVIWDPFQAAADVATGARTLADGTGIVSNYQFY